MWFLIPHRRVRCCGGLSVGRHLFCNRPTLAANVMIHDGIEQSDVVHLAVNEVSFFGHDLNETISVGALGTNQPRLLVLVSKCFHGSSFRWLVKLKHDFSAFKVSCGDTATCDSCFGQSPFRKVSGPMATNIIAPFDRLGQIILVAMNAMRGSRL